jgi:hypothetical protein
MDMQKILTLSKKHLSMSTRQKLSHKNRTNCFTFLEVYNKANFGWFIYINEEAFKESCRFNNIPGDLKALISFALESGCTVLCIDEQVEPLMCLPYYECRFNVRVMGGNPGETGTVESVFYGGCKIASHKIEMDE